MVDNFSSASYQQFPEDDGEEDAPQEGGAVIHIIPESGKAVRWNHIDDLDSFFTRVYLYHKRHGFFCMSAEELLELCQLMFIAGLVIVVTDCLNYDVLFKNKPLNGTGKVSFLDGIYSMDVCLTNIGAIQWILIVLASLFWMIRLFKVIINIFRFWDVKAFFNTALDIMDRDLANVTWYQVQKRLREVQLEQQMCIHKKELTELDIYHRILRYQNYMVAMVNKGFLPPKFHLPFIGEVVYLSYGLKFNLEMLFFWGPWSPFDNWHLKEDYKKQQKKKELANSLQRIILYAALFNLLLCPLILLWQIVHAFVNYAEVVKREPSMLSARCWSLHGKYYLRHFNELDHELNARLNRAYRPASKYVNSFTSPLLTILSKFVVYVAGSTLAVLVAFSVYDEDFLTVEHVLTAITILGAIVAASRVLIPDENQVWWPEHLMNSVLAHIHYLPSHWRGNAHTLTVRNEFTHLFQYKATFLLTELFSPIITPILLVTHIRPKALEFVDFFRCFTVEVGGVGDVCSFAQMDIRAHGNPDWNPNPNRQPSNYMGQAEEGKIEMSLIHFTLANPEWSPPAESEGFISTVKEEARRQWLQEASHQSLYSGSMDYDEAVRMNYFNNAMIMRNTSRMDGPPQDRNHPHGYCLTPSLGASVFGTDGPADPMETMAMDMSINALYLHQAHQRTIERRGGARQPVGAHVGGYERVPLLSSPSRLS